MKKEIFESVTKVEEKEVMGSGTRSNLEEVSYQYDNSRPWHLMEPAVAYDVTRKRKQGEYTLDDYYNLPEERRVELIDGVIYDMGAPAFLHQVIAGQIYYDVRRYIDAKGGKCIPVLSPVDVCLDCDNKTMVQPDLIIICDKNKISVESINGLDRVIFMTCESNCR